MATTPMTDLLARTERPEPVFDVAAVAGWPTGALDELVILGILTGAEPAATAVCDACPGDHVEPVRWVRNPDAPLRACIVCPEFGVVWLAPGDLRRWVVRLPVLARLVAAALGASGGVSERVPNRVWKLGTVRVGGRTWVGHLAFGLTRPDAAAVVEQVPEMRAANALVFVPSAVPADSVWSADRAPAVVPLCDLLALGPNGLVGDRGALGSAVTPAAGPVSKGPARVFSMPPGTTWEQVTLTVEERHVRVQAGTTVERFEFAEAGFEDRRERGCPDELWTLLGGLARFRGVMGTGDHITTKSGRLKQKVSTLRDRLRALLVLEGDPFRPNRKGQPYRSRFTIRSAGAATFPTPPGATWDDITVTEITTDVVEVAVTAELRGAGYVRGEEQGGGGRWKGTTGTSERRFRFSLADFIGTDDSQSSAGEALVAVLRARGRLNRGSDDAAVLALGAALTRFFQLAPAPFTFDPKRRMWVARFEAASLVPVSDR